MKKIICLTLFVLCFIMTAAAKTKGQRVILTLTSDSVVYGYLRWPIAECEYDKFKVKKDFDSEYRTFKSCDIKKMLVIENENDTVLYIPVTVQWDGDKKPDSTPAILSPVYESANCKAYVDPNVYTKRNAIGWETVKESYIYYLALKKDNFVAKPYFHTMPGNDKAAMRQLIKRFKAYPEFKGILDSRGITKKQICNDPTLIPKILDEIIEK